MVSVSPSTCTKPAGPPRWETSTPPLAIARPLVVTTKKVSAAAICARAAWSSPVKLSNGASLAASSSPRGWMYCGQLPKLWATSTIRPSSPA